MIRRIAENIIIFCLICILGITLYNIYEKDRTYRENQTMLQELPSKDFGELSKINPDIQAWLEYEPLEIDGPVVQGDDNDKYLNTLFNGEYNAKGCFFVDYICIAPFKQFNTTIYGHHMYDGTMFGHLRKLKEEEYARKHPKFTLYLPDGVYDLNVCAFLNPRSDSDVYMTNLPDEEIPEYIATIKKEAIYTIGEITPEDRLVLLSTCAYEYKDARYVVVCKMSKTDPIEVKVENEPTKLDRIVDRIKGWFKK